MLSATTTVENVRVAIRVRPATCGDDESISSVAASSRGVAAGSITVGADGREVLVPSQPSASARFTFDAAFDGSSRQEAIFESVALPVVENVLRGYNGTVMVYGQSGSGKTHAMFGPRGGDPALLRGDERGVIPRTFERLFDELAKQRRPASEVEWSVDLAVVELYNEDFFDLLALDSEAPSASFLRIREDRAPGGRGIYIENLSSRRVASVDDAMGALDLAAKKKHMGGTRLNETSSRSHTIVMVTLVQVDHVDHDARTVSQLFLIDLAGSERIAKTGAAGDRLKEAQRINLSLTLLGNVINKLTDATSLHIPYRDSKLTRLLQDSLGGNSRTTLLCTCSPSAANLSESISTLQFAQRAKRIQNAAKINKELSAEDLHRAFAAAQQEIAALKLQLATIRETYAAHSASSPPLVPAFGAAPGGVVSPTSLQQETNNGASLIESLLAQLDAERAENASLTRELDGARAAANFHAGRHVDADAMCSSLTAQLEALKAQLAVTPKPVTRKASTIAPSPPPPPQQQQQSQSRISFSSAKKQQSASPATPTQPQVPPQVGEHSEGKLHMAVAREQHLIAQLADVRRKLEAAEASAAERLVAHEAELEAKDAALRRQDDEIGRLQLRLDELRQGRQVVGGASVAAKESGEAAHLEAENRALHAENRANATRLLDFTRRIEQLTKELKAAADQRAKLLRDIELAEIDGAIKEKLLASEIAQLQAQVGSNGSGAGGPGGMQQQSRFRQRLYDCFAVDETGRIRSASS